MRQQFYLYAITLAVALSAASCKEDYFDPDAYNERVQAAFPVQNIDPQHTWSTVGQAFVRIAVNKKAGETFKLRIYDKNPLSKPEGMAILLDGRVKDGETFTGSLNYGQATDVVYVALTDAQGYMSVYPQGIIDGKVELQIGGQTAAAARRQAPMRVQTQYGYDFPDAPASSSYATGMPANAIHGTEYIQTVDNVYIDESNNGQKVQVSRPWDGVGCAKVYVVSNGTTGIVEPGEFYLDAYYQDWNNGGAIYPESQRYHLYITPGVTLKLNATASGNLQAGLVVHVAPGATLECDGELKLNSLTIYNAGTITAPSVSGNGPSVLYNQGTLGVEGELSVTTSNTAIVNEGTITASSLGTYGSGAFWNNGGTVTIDNATVVNSNANVWINDGTYTTGSFSYTAGSVAVVNNCHLTVDETFLILLGDNAVNSFLLNAGASVQTQDFRFVGPGKIVMGEGALFNIDGTAYMGITKDEYGIYGPSTGGYAVFQALHIVRGQTGNEWYAYDVDANQAFVANYFGHLYVATDDHFSFGYSDKSAEQQAAGEVGSQPYYRLDAASGAQMVGYGQADVHTTDSGCGADYEGEPQEEEPEAEALSYRYCYEDNFPEPGDYDFNDAVITVTPITDGTTSVTLRVSLDAVGASEQIAAALRIKNLSPDDVVSCTRSIDPDEGLPYRTDNSYARIIRTDEVMLPQAMKTTQAQDDVVLLLFNNAHWTLGRQTASAGSVDNSFINTVPTSNDFEPKRNGVEPVTIEFNFELTDASKANYFAQSFLDPFIVQGYNGGYWEVHPVPYKFDEVLSEYYKNLRADYDDSDKKPWAICVVGSFSYPVEWTPINEAYSTPGHSFSEWATDRTQATDWYEYPNAEMVY